MLGINRRSFKHKNDIFNPNYPTSKFINYDIVILSRWSISYEDQKIFKIKPSWTVAFCL